MIDFYVVGHALPSGDFSLSACPSGTPVVGVDLDEVARTADEVGGHVYRLTAPPRARLVWAHPETEDEWGLARSVVELSQKDMLSIRKSFRA